MDYPTTFPKPAATPALQRIELRSQRGCSTKLQRTDKDGTCLLLLIAVHTVRQLLEQLIGRET